MPSLGPEDPLEKEMATQSSILAWEIPWTEESGGLWSMGSQKSQAQLSDETSFQKKSKIYHLKGTDIKLENTTISPKWDVLKNTLFFTIFA